MAHSEAPAPIAVTGWAGAHIVSASQLCLHTLTELFAVARNCEKLEHADSGLLRGRILASAFLEPSTRTSCSFAAAMMRLGGTVIQINEATSSAAKGESIEDSMRALQCYADVLVLRSPRTGDALRASRVLSLPLINAGDGVGEHPTQALLDTYTILRELSRSPTPSLPRPLRVAMVGDLTHGRTVHSLAQMLAMYPDVHLHFVAPPELGMPPDLVSRLTERGVCTHTHTRLGDGGLSLADIDVLYVTRVQKERFSDPAEYERLKHAFIVTPESLAAAPTHMCVMHPLPRVGEIDTRVDADPRAAYFRQMKNGLYVRMALLALVCGVTPDAIAEAAARV